MGEYADLFLSGLVDQFTGEVIDGDAPGYPRSKSDAPRRIRNKGKFVCEDCGRLFKTEQGKKDHRRDVHSQS